MTVSTAYSCRLRRALLLEQGRGCVVRRCGVAVLVGRSRAEPDIVLKQKECVKCDRCQAQHKLGQIAGNARPIVQIDAVEYELQIAQQAAGKVE